VSESEIYSYITDAKDAGVNVDARPGRRFWARLCVNNFIARACVVLIVCALRCARVMHSGRARLEFTSAWVAPGGIRRIEATRSLATSLRLVTSPAARLAMVLKQRSAPGA